ncbi:MAG: hypothetical protein JW880_01600 [Candidatus Thermoplasmatota archaeon]|nr:hypothetical protein [Candidatus Thermoplasmatota archaeon]
MFCVECGREGALIGSLCVECYSKRHPVASLPDHVDLTLCAHCSSMQTAHGWEDIGSVREAAEAAIEASMMLEKGASISDISVRLVESDERNIHASVSVVATMDGRTFERELRTMVRLKRGSCTECSKQQGNYYEAILQVRGQGRELPREVEREMRDMVTSRVAAMRKSSREVFLSRIESVKGGLDFYFSTIGAARTVARELQDRLCAEFKESSSLWGRKGGKEVSRMTFLVRLLGFSRGDVAEHGGREYYIRGLSRGVVHAVDIATGEERAIKTGESEKWRLLLERAQIPKAVVLVDSEREIQVLDPETNSPLELRKPGSFSRKGEQIRLVKTKRGAYVLSDSW